MDQKSSNSSEGSLGNTNILPSPRKQVSPAKKWCFTLNNYTMEEYSSIRYLLSQNCDYGIIGKEIGENGTPHLQGYLRFVTKQRPMAMFQNKRIHWECAKGTHNQNIKYCSKDGEAWIYDAVAEQMQLVNYEDMYIWQRDIIDMCKEVPDKRSIHWFWSENGRVGKTELQK